MRLADALDATAIGPLRRIASAHGLAGDDGTTRTELIARVLDRLVVGDYLRDQVASLSEAERDVLNRARAHPDGEIRALLAERDAPGVSETLTARGLAFRVFAAAGPLRGEVLIVPTEVLDTLPEPVEPSGPARSEAPTSADRRGSDPAFSLFCLASALSRRGARLEDDVRAWSEEPGGWPWDTRWTFLRHLAESSGLIVRQADGSPGLGPSLVRLLDNPHQVAARLWRAYLRDRSLSELSASGFADGIDLAAAVPLREAIVATLGDLPVGTWYTVAALLEWMRTTQPNVVREQLTARGVILAESLDWDALEARVLRYVLLGPLYWLGVVAVSADGTMLARRTGPDAALSDHAKVSHEPCTWSLANELMTPVRAALGTLLQAERYLVLRERGRPSIYGLVGSHVAAALGTGGSLDECRALLRRLTTGLLPDVVEDRLREWDRRFGALSIRPAVLLEGRSTGELDAALSDAAVRGFVRARLSETVAEVAAADALELAAALRSADHLPQVDAALRLASDARRAYAGLIDEQVLEFLLVSLLVFSRARPEHLSSLEGSATLLERLERQFPPERLKVLRAEAARLATDLGPARAAGRSPKGRRRRTTGQGFPPRA